MAVILGRAITLPAWPGFGLSLVALFFYFLSSAPGAFVPLNLALSGILAGLALLYRVNFGGYVALVIALDFVIECWTSDRAHRWKELLFGAAAFVVPMLACVFIFCLLVYGKRFVDGIADFTVTSQKIMLQYRFIGLKWSFQLAGAVLFPFVWFACACCRPATRCHTNSCLR